MKINHLLVGFCCMVGFITCAANKANLKKDTLQTVLNDSSYDVSVYFGSRCCGTVSSKFLDKFLKTYHATATIKVKAYIAEGCGKEGEFFILFKIDIKDKKLFVEQLVTLVNEQEIKNRTADTNSGDLEIKYDVNKSDIDYCRTGIRVWQPGT
ncbi:MAG: hypothetical protein WEA59_07655 [Ferruginibacter sp.]